MQSCGTVLTSQAKTHRRAAAKQQVACHAKSIEARHMWITTSARQLDLHNIIAKLDCTLRNGSLCSSQGISDARHQ